MNANEFSELSKLMTKGALDSVESWLSICANWSFPKYRDTIKQLYKDFCVTYKRNYKDDLISDTFPQCRRIIKGGESSIQCMDYEEYRNILYLMASPDATNEQVAAAIREAYGLEPAKEDRHGTTTA